MPKSTPCLPAPAALALSMLLLFQPEAGIAGASILTSGILLLLLSALHALLRASRISHKTPPNSRADLPRALYENDSAQTGDWNGKNSAPPPEIQREFSFPFFPEGKSRPGSASGSDRSSVGSAGSREFQREFRDLSGDLPRTHRTLSEDSGLLREQGKPWNVLTREMRNVLMARKAAGKGSTLV